MMCKLKPHCSICITFPANLHPMICVVLALGEAPKISFTFHKHISAWNLFAPSWPLSPAGWLPKLSVEDWQRRAGLLVLAAVDRSIAPAYSCQYGRAAAALRRWRPHTAQLTRSRSWDSDSVRAPVARVPSGLPTAVHCMQTLVQPLKILITLSH